MASHSSGMLTQPVPGADPRLSNQDLAPTAPEGRTWGAFSVFAMWMSDVHSVGGYTFAASLSTLGWLSFLFMWFFQLAIFQSGMETIRKFIDFCGPAVYVVMFLLAGWILWQAGLSSLSLRLGRRQYSGLESLGAMANAAI